MPPDPNLVLYPAFCWGLLLGILNIEPEWAKPALMVAAAPGSPMSFVLALNYGVPTKSIARIILITMTGALPTVTYFSSV